MRINVKSCTWLQKKSTPQDEEAWFDSNCFEKRSNFFLSDL